jgi:hypothetical protein
VGLSCRVRVGDLPGSDFGDPGVGAAGQAPLGALDGGERTIEIPSDTSAAQERLVEAFLRDGEQ